MESTIDLGEYYAQRLTAEMMPDMVHLYKASFHQNISSEELNQRHIYCHGEDKYIGYIAYNKLTNKPAAYYGVFPTYVYYNTRKVLAVQSGDTMTHPDHQKKGLFVSLAKATYTFCQQLGMEFVIGFPNSKSYHGLVKHLGFIEYHRLKNIQLCENRFGVGRFMQQSDKVYNKYFSFVKALLLLFFKQGAVFQNSNRFAENIIYPEHDIVYAQQKDTGNKFWIIVDGVNVLVKIDRQSLIIGDIDTVDEKRIGSIVRKLKFFVVLAGLRFLSAGMSDTASLFQPLEKLATQVSVSNPLLLLDLGTSLPLKHISLLNSDMDVY